MTERSEIDAGTPGGSARREHEQRQARREAKAREHHPRLGSLLLRIQSAPASETAWKTGAEGDIDHLAVAPSGVFVIDAKRYKGKIEVRKPFFGDHGLFIAGRDKTKLVEGLARHQEAVRSALAAAIPEMPVHACFCFLNPAGQAGGSDLPLIRTLNISGFPLLYPRTLSRRLNAPGALTVDSRQEVAELLATALPSAAG